MKIFDCDWTVILDFIPVWDEMSPSSRKIFLDQNKPHTGGARKAEYGKDAERMLESRLVLPNTRHSLVPEKERGKLFRRIFMQLAKHPLFETDTGSRDFEAYRKKHFLAEEEISLGGHTNADGREIHFLTEAWSRAFLECGDPIAWEEPLKIYEPSSRPYGWGLIALDPENPPKKITYFNSPEVGRAALEMVRVARESNEPVPFHKLNEPRSEGITPQMIADAFKACLRYALLFPSLHRDSYEACFWIWPPAGRRLHRPAAQGPAPVPQANPLAAPPFYLEDLSLVGSHLLTEPLPVKKYPAGNELYARTEREITLAMGDLPPFLEKRFSRGWRLAAALERLRALDFTTVAQGKQASLKLRKAGADWLAANASDRLRFLIDTFSANREKGGNWCFEDRQSASLGFTPLRLFTSKRYGGDTVGLSALLERVWSSAREGEFYGLEEWLTYHSQHSYPDGVDPQDRIGESPYRNTRTFEEIGEDLLRTAHERFFFERLIPLGCVDLGEGPQGELRFALNETGNYFLTGTGSVTSVGDPAGGILIQPNFEIVFTRPNPLAEAELAGLAERCGRSVGTLFRLTRESVRRTALAGIDAGRFLETLERLSSKPLPTNVRLQIDDWYAACREVRMRQSLLLTFPDEATAQTVAKELNGQCQPITKTIWELRTKSLDAKTRRKLEKKGIFFRTGN